jgi:phosphosulfolactate phosphohydrolase-like enzyme
VTVLPHCFSEDSTQKFNGLKVAEHLIEGHFLDAKQVLQHLQKKQAWRQWEDRNTSSQADKLFAKSIDDLLVHFASKSDDDEESLQQYLRRSGSQQKREFIESQHQDSGLQIMELNMDQ